MAREPQECPACRMTLRDPEAPRRFRHQFTLALFNEQTGEYRCPGCGHTWRTKR